MFTQESEENEAIQDQSLFNDWDEKLSSHTFHASQDPSLA